MEKQKVTIGSPLVSQNTGPVRVRIMEGPSKGLGLLEISVDYEKAVVPSRSYCADYCRVLEARADLTFIFGRLKPTGAELRSIVEVSFPREMFVSLVWQASRQLHAGLIELGEPLLPPANPDLDIDKALTVRSNNVFMAVMGEEAILDFYYIAPNELHYATQGRRREIALEGVIRISLSRRLLREFLSACDELGRKIRAEGEGGQEYEPGTE